MAGDSVGVYRRSEKNLIGINISNSRNRLLMHEKRLKTPSIPLQEQHKIFLRDDQGIRAKAAGHITLKSLGIEQRDSSEPSRIPIAKSVTGALVKCNDYMNMLGMLDDCLRQ